MKEARVDDINDICFFDFESRGRKDLDRIGAYQYAKTAKPIILTYAFGDDPVRCVAVNRFEDRLIMPPELLGFMQRGNTRFVAWNCAFDRLMWNSIPGYPRLPIERTMDAMAQAVAANLPGKLEHAAKAVGGALKDKEGKRLIKLFCDENGTATPQSHPADWAAFKSYAKDDIEAMRSVWKATPKRMDEEWTDYHVSERINERGVMVDVPVCERAAEVFVQGKAWSNAQLQKVTGLPKIKITNVKTIAGWLHANLEDAKARSLIEHWIEDEDEEGGEEEEAHDPTLKLHLRRPNVTALRIYLQGKRKRTEIEERAIAVLELREYGGSTSPAKFAKMVAQADADDGRIRGAYVLNGAGQTGRFSSRGIQVHNLPRDSFGEIEEEVLCDLLELPVADFIAKYPPVNQTLARLARPALVAPKRKVLVWCDWSNIEARVNPWLSDSRSGKEKLVAFEKADGGGPDIYMQTAGGILYKAPEDVTKAERQAYGKVPELSLGFGGSHNALLRMADTYGVKMGEDEAKQIVQGWRGANPWARHFWDALWLAIQRAMTHHKMVFEAGRIAYQFEPKILGGSLLCALPNGRLLTYPQAKWQVKEKVGQNGEPYQTEVLTYRKGHGRADLWFGKACENVTQAAAGSILRDKLFRLDEAGLPVVLHTHDDICVEVEEDRAEQVKVDLRAIMLEPEQWTAGLPLDAKASSNWWFTKAAD
jgi:DNA polymerase